MYQEFHSRGLFRVTLVLDYLTHVVSCGFAGLSGVTKSSSVCKVADKSTVRVVRVVLPFFVFYFVENRYSYEKLLG